MIPAPQTTRSRNLGWLTAAAVLAAIITIVVVIAHVYDKPHVFHDPGTFSCSQLMQSPGPGWGGGIAPLCGQSPYDQTLPPAPGG